MRSAHTPADDLTARARIRDSAIVYFGRHGFRSATVRAIAADAGVSPALVIHHFGSKDGLREACDAYASDCIDDLTRHASTHLEAVDLMDLISRTPQLSPLVPYMIQTITEGGKFAARLWDLLVRDTETYLTAAVKAGKVRPTADERARAEVISTFKLGMYMLARYLVPPPADAQPADVDIVALSNKFTVPIMELFTHGMYTTSDYLDAFVAHQQSRTAEPDLASGSPGPPGATPSSPSPSPARAETPDVRQRA